MLPNSQRWFAPILAAPTPEESERACIGLVFGNGRADRVEFERGLPRLRCFVSRSTAAMFEQLLVMLRKRIEAGEEWSTLCASLEPQILVEPPRSLLAPYTEATIAALRAQYLNRPEGGGLRDVATRVRADAEAKLDELFLPSLPLNVSVTKHAQFRTLYPSVSVDPKVGVEPHPVSRVLRSHARDLIVEAIDFSPRRRLTTLEVNALAIGKNFWAYRRLEPAIRRVSGRQLQSVGVIFNGAKQKPKAHEELESYIAHYWANEADRVIHVSQPSDVGELDEMLDWVSDRVDRGHP